MTNKNDNTQLLGLSLVCMSIVTMEIVITRIFSVIMWYHLAFFSVSLAMFGLTLGAVAVFLAPGRFTGERAATAAAYSAALFAVTTVLGAYLILKLHIPFTLTAITLSYLIAIFLALAIPFFFGGLCVSIVITSRSEIIGRVYFFDLAGAGLGCVAAVFFLNAFGGAVAVVAAAGTAAAGALLLAAGAGAGGKRASAAALAALVFLGLFATGNHWTNWLRIRYAKGSPVGGLLYQGWNSFSWVTVSKNDKEPSYLNLNIDLGAATFIPRTKEGGVGYFKSWNGVPEFVHFVKRYPRALVIGPGGGNDVATALAHGAGKVTAVELNPLIVNVVKTQFAGFSGNLYNRPDVEIHTGDGRTFVEQAEGRRWDLIQLSLVDTFAATTSGALSLSENNLYTVDAFESYLNHLSPNGILNITHGNEPVPRITARFTALFRETMRRRGARLDDRIMIVGQGIFAGFMLKKSPFTNEEIDALESAAKREGKTILYTPKTRPDNVFTRIITAPDIEKLYAEYRFNIRPVTDDSPFFFNTTKTKDILSTLSSDSNLNAGLFFLLSLIAVTLVFSALVIVVPLAMFRSADIRGAPGWGRPAAYFSLLGLGFTIFELCMAQKFILFLGTPVYAFSATVFSLLLSSGIGSLLSQRLGLKNMRAVFYCLSGYMVVCVFALDPVIHSLQRDSIYLKTAAAAGVIAPAGLLMGMAFPLGVAALNRWKPALLPWMWGINGIMGILGSSLEMIAALFFGFKAVLVITALLYFAASVFLGKTISLGGEERRIR